MLTLRPEGSSAQPQSPRGIHRTAVLAAAEDGKNSGERDECEWSAAGAGGRMVLTVENLTNEVSFFGRGGVVHPSARAFSERVVRDD